MTIKSFINHLKSRDVDVCLRHDKNVIWSGELQHLPGRYRHYKIDTFFWDDYAMMYDLKFFRENDIIVKEIK